jgi:hypothetical protein
MALSFFSGSFTIASGLGTQAVAGVGFQPRVVLAYWLRSTADQTFTAHAGIGMGVAVDRGTDQQSCIVCYNTDAVATSDSAQAKDTAAFIKNIASVGPGFNVIATIASFDSDGFTINKTTNDGTNLNIIKFVCLGGTDITDAFLLECTSPATAISQAYTGVGFEGNLAMFFGIRSSTSGTTSATGSSLFVGAATSSSSEMVVAAYANDNEAGAAYAESYVNSAACVAIGGGTSLAIRNLADFTSFDADGFTLNFSAVGIASVRFFALILKGTFQAAIGMQARTITAATVDQDVTTTPSFQPAGVLLAGTFATANATETGQAHLVLGAGDGTNSHGLWYGDAAADTSEVDSYTSGSNVYTQATNPSTVAAQASLSMISTGYRLNWTTTDANARVFGHVALGSAEQPSRPMFRGS